MTSEMTLEPCPFCGGNAVAENYIVEAQVVCLGCRAKIVRSHGAHTDNGVQETFAAWNTRTHLTKPAQAVDVDEPIAWAWHSDGMKGWALGHVKPTPENTERFHERNTIVRGLYFDPSALSGEKAGPVDGWISVTDRLPECDMTPNSFGVPVEVKPGFFDGMKRVPNAFYGCRQTDRPNFYLYGAVFYPTHWRYPASPRRTRRGHEYQAISHQ